MTQTFGQLPRRNPPRTTKESPAASGAMIAVFLLFVFSLFPRLWIIAFWIFGRELGQAFGSWVIPAAGFIVLPWTTLLYAWMWAIGSDAVHGWEWLPVAVGFLLDLSFLAAVRNLFR
jgi:hypothetical protein